MMTPITINIKTGDHSVTENVVAPDGTTTRRYDQTVLEEWLQAPRSLDETCLFLDLFNLYW